MRKLLIFVILALVLVSSLVGACIASDGVKTAVVNILVGIFGPVWVFISIRWSNLASTVGASGTYFLFYTCIIVIFGGLLFVALNRAKNAGKLPLTKKAVASTPKPTPYQDQLSTPELYTPAPGKAATSEPPTPKVEEVTAE